MRDQRTAGILLHPVSLPSADGIGDFGPYAFSFVDFLEKSGMGVWQILPLGPTAYGNSPYTAISSFAGNPLMISLELLGEQGLLQKNLAKMRPEFSPDRVDYPAVYAWKLPLLREAALSFLEGQKSDEYAQYEEFCSREQWWLDDYALFVTAKQYFDEKAAAEGVENAIWNYYWPEALAKREPDELERRRKEWAREIDIEKVLQFFFARQWQAVKSYANEKGIEIFGDIPVFVAPDSSDVWAHPELFKLDKNLRPTKVAGVPPDYFSATGQRWGNPLYRWEEHQRTGFSWWIARMKKSLELCDIVRIDHFRGFEACWEIPASEENAVKGKWVTSPGRELFEALSKKLGAPPVVAEDLGVITPEVDQLRRDFGFPGMKVLQFAFERQGVGLLNTENPFLPHNDSPLYVAYTGTHDNDTTLGWYESLDPEMKSLVSAYVGSGGDHPVWDLIRVLFMSVARYAIIPFQDALLLGNDARMNTPATVGGNWSWRVRSEALNHRVSEKLHVLLQLYGRLAQRNGQ